MTAATRTTVAGLAAALLVFVSVLTPSHAECLQGDDAKIINKNARANLYDGEQKFTLNMLRAINQTSEQENVFFSPYSTYHALLLAYFGAQGQTEKELREVLNLDWAQSKYEVFQAYRFEKNNRQRRFENSAVVFKSVDKIYVSETASLETCMQDLFIDELEVLNFNANPEKCRMLINAFVADVTANNIKDILVEGSISQQTNIVLANAAYFKGNWKYQFNPEHTEKAIFYASQTKREFVDMMSKTANYNHAVNERLGCHVLEIPYVGEEQEISMVIFLPPNTPEALEGVLNRLTPNELQQALDEGMLREVEVKVPKFSFEKTYQLVPILNSMGVRQLFEPSSNLTSFTKSNGLQLDDAIHKAKIEVNEEGSTAAAATVLFSFRSSRPTEPAQFFCDHPFMFLIYDYKAKAVLFTGLYRGSN